MNESIKITGSVEVVLTDAEGNIKHRHVDHNVITTIGKTYLAAWLAAPIQAGPFMQYIGLGSGTTPASAADTALQTELTVAGYSRSTATVSSVNTSWFSVSVFPAGDGTATISEAGIFSAASAGTLFAHQVFSPVTKAATDSITITWTVVFG
jgi:hypothetical protein